MLGGTMTIEGPRGAFQALVRRPAGADPHPAVVVIQEIFGVNAAMVQVAERLAADGFTAVAPDLFHQFEPGIVLDDRDPEDLQRAFQLFPKYDVDRGVDDVRATVEAVRRLPQASGKVGALGFCLGGLQAYLAATRTDADAVVSYYGVNIDAFLGEADQIAHPLLLHIAGEDQFVPREAQDRIIAGLKDRPGVEVHRYEGSDHAFARPGGDHYDAGAAKIADGRTHDFLRLHLGAGV